MNKFKVTWENGVVDIYTTPMDIETFKARMEASRWGLKVEQMNSPIETIIEMVAAPAAPVEEAPKPAVKPRTRRSVKHD